MLDLNGAWGWSNIQSKDSLVEIVEKLKNYESMTWSEIEKINNSHLIPINKISKKARERLIERELGDLETLYSFRLSGRERLWGNRDNEAFYIIWWDPKHTVYPVQKKHT